ncbi:MAG TPA: TIGR02300 family protein [Caulobacteraceae bacterium]|nr:TIGR02300 family protein [Caulobacteraceae bacterium]
MVNPALGAKQICPSCATKFYDLNRRPAACPKCGVQFDPEEALRNRRVRARVGPADEEAEEEKVVTAAADGDEGVEAEVEEAPELDQVTDEPPLIADDEEIEEPDQAPPAPSETLGVDFAEEDDLEEADDDEVPFIEDEDDDFSEDEIDGLPSGDEGEEA